MIVSNTMREATSEPRRGNEPGDENYLRMVGERVRSSRVQQGMSRKLLSQTSGVSERYLAELERGTGNASLLVLRRIAAALQLRVDEIVHESMGRPPELASVLRQLEDLRPHELQEVREIIVRRFNGKDVGCQLGRIALVGLRGAGKSVLGRNAAKALGIPCVELDREIERASGMDLAEIFAVHGEPVYRRLEHESLDAAIKAMPKAIITTGGGIVLEPETYDKLLKNCFVVWVTASEHQLVSAARHDLGLVSQRLSPRARAEFENAMRTRAPLYAKADAVLDTTGKSDEQVLDALLSLTKSAEHVSTIEQPAAQPNGR